MLSKRQKQRPWSDCADAQLIYVPYSTYGQPLVFIYCIICSFLVYSYIRQVIDETLRIAVISPVAARFQDVESNLGGYKIPKNVRTLIAIGKKEILYMSREVRKHVCPVKIQIRLCECVVWSESSLGAFWIGKDAKFLHAENEASHQTVRMCRLICFFVGAQCHIRG